MNKEVFDLGKDYEWIGKFWFPSEDESQINEFSGKVTFSPERGICLKLIATHSTQVTTARKIMHAYVDGKAGQLRISLIDVFLNVSLISGAYTFTGWASALIGNEFVASKNFNQLIFQYDEHFENVFLMPLKKERDILQYSKSDALILGNNFKVKCDAYGWSTFVVEDDFDAMFVSRNECSLDELKKAIRPFLNDKILSLGKRLETYFQIIFESENKDIWEFTKTEAEWRLYWELLVDHPINIKYAFASLLRKTQDGTEYTSHAPLLFSPRRMPGHLDKAKDIHRLPINFRSFSSCPYDFKVLEEPVGKWLEISGSDDWQTVVNGIKWFIGTNNSFADTTKYISLVSDIETFLDLTGEKSVYVDRLIELYGYTKWEQSLRKLPVDIPPAATLGKWFTEIRNVIAHPKSCSRKAGGKYKKIVLDTFLLHQIYSHLAALLMKGVLEHVGGVEKKSLEDFTNVVIENRCAYGIIEYID